MSFLPIVERELQRAMRRKSTYRIRVGAALASFLLSAWIILTIGSIIIPEELGAKLFHTLSTLALYCCLTAGIFLTADCLSEEKRNGTLGLLFLTHLNGYDVVAGKLFAHSLHAFYSLLAILPAMAIPFFLGGITGGEFWRMAALLTSTLLLSLTTGILVSALSWREQRAILATAALLICLSYILPATSRFFQGLSPVQALSLANDSSYKTSPARFLTALFTFHGLSWLCFLLASFWIRRTWRENVSAWTPKPILSPTHGNTPRLCGGMDPLTWLTQRADQRAWVWSSLALILLALILAGHTPSQFTTVLGMLALHLTLQFWIAWEAGHRLNQDRRAGGLETILSTPVGPSEIVRAQLQSLKSEFIAPVAAVVSCDFLLLLNTAVRSTGSSDLVVHLATVSIAIILVLLVSLYAQAWLGLWFGLRLTKASTATLANLLCTVLLPTITLMLFALLMTTTTAIGPDGLTALAVAWIILGGMSSCFFYRYAEEKLQTEFRSAANRTFDMLETNRSAPTHSTAS